MGHSARYRCGESTFDRAAYRYEPRQEERGPKNGPSLSLFLQFEEPLYALRALVAMHALDPDAARGRLQEVLNRARLDCAMFSRGGARCIPDHVVFMCHVRS